MSASKDTNTDESKTAFTGFHIQPRDKKKLDFMAEFFYNEKWTEQPTYSEAARKCLDIGWLIVNQVIEARAEGRNITTVTFTLPKIEFQRPTYPQEGY